ncbi:MAG: hypothetical protein KF901_32555 [Myxococcales bacterium]|nr:hypothetical protein [Myxococcales bacterium]
MMGITAKDPLRCLQRAGGLGLTPPWPATSASLDYDAVKGFRPGHDESLLLEKAKEKLVFKAPRGARWSISVKAQAVQVSWLVESFPVVDAHLLSQLDFLYASFGTRYPEWDEHKGPLWYERGGTGAGHWGLGWGFALQGEGHEHLVSRRWLDHGPWRVTYGPNDTTLVQFHDLDVDAATAARQATEGHKLWSHYLSGGFISDRDTFVRLAGPHRPKPENALYVADDRSIRIIIHGRPIPEGEMRETGSWRIYPPTPDQPVDSVRYVFMDMAQALSYLHALWLRGIEVYAMTPQGEVRLDDTFTPPPVEKPDWVRALDARGNAQDR